jgi:FAD dependent oxidoreductase
MRAKIAVAGAGIYGATAAIRLAELGHQVQLFDPLGIIRAASAINQYRVHSGYHYPRSPETIREILEARAEFIAAFRPAIVGNSRHYYAIPKEHSRTPPDLYEKLMAQYGLALRPYRPDWLNFKFIDRCYEVNEHIYDPGVLRSLVEARITELGVQFEQRAFLPEMRDGYDYVIWATYGLGGSRGVFPMAKFQIAEKILIELPAALRGVALVVVDGPFTGFDPYGRSSRSLFGSAQHTNHKSTTDSAEPLPEPYATILNGPEFEPVPFTHFEAMRRDCSLAVPSAKDANYIGSRFTIRVVEDNPEQDRRILHVRAGAPGELHIFSGKVVSAVKAARLVCEWVAGHD